MAIDGEARQISVELEETARTFAHSARDVPSPIDPYLLLAELSRATDHLQQTARQLGALQRRVIDGREHFGEDDRGDGAFRTIEAAEQLQAAVAALDRAGEAIRDALHADGVVRRTGR